MSFYWKQHGQWLHLVTVVTADQSHLKSSGCRSFVSCFICHFTLSPFVHEKAGNCTSAARKPPPPKSSDEAKAAAVDLTCLRVCVCVWTQQTRIWHTSTSVHYWCCVPGSVSYGGGMCGRWGRGADSGEEAVWRAKRSSNKHLRLINKTQPSWGLPFKAQKVVGPGGGMSSVRTALF